MSVNTEFHFVYVSLNTDLIFVSLNILISVCVLEHDFVSVNTI